MKHAPDRPGIVFSEQYSPRPAAYPQTPADGLRRDEAMRRRVIVFAGVFAVCAVASLSYVFMRPATYLASARIQITPAGKLTSGEATAPDRTPALLLELQVLTSRPLLEGVAKGLATDGGLDDLGPDPAGALQDMVKVNRLEGSNVVQIEATGPQRQLLPRLVNGLVEQYREQQASTNQSVTQAELDDARDEVRIVDARLAEKKRAVENFRMRSNIVSGERDENRTLSALKGLGVSLSAATEREAIAEGKVQALEQAVDDGKRSPLAKDNPTVAGMEQRLSQWREEWRALERQFTPQYLDMDPNARALRTRIANLEQQLDGERGKSRDNALAAAREELASARGTTRRLQQQLADTKQSTHNFSRNFAEFQSMQEELRGLEQMRTAARQRLVGLEASVAARRPLVQVLESATTPLSAWRPLYARDAGFALAGSLALAFLAVWFVEFFNRKEPAPAGPTTVIVPQPWAIAPPPPMPRIDLASGTAALSPAEPATLLSAPPLARELSDDEVRRLLANAAPEHLPLLVCLLCGLTAAEVTELRVADVELPTRSMTVPGQSSRRLTIEGPLLEAVSHGAGLPPDTPLVEGAAGKRLTVAEAQSIVVSSALDAGLSEAQHIDADTLRHTYIAFLVRQGLRFSVLGKLVGASSVEALNALASLAPGIPRVGLDEIDRLLPAVRSVAPGVLRSGGPGGTA
jgi:succinoglycan biosynthesis transport protein ExoP